MQFPNAVGAHEAAESPRARAASVLHAAAIKWVPAPHDESQPGRHDRLESIRSIEIEQACRGSNDATRARPAFGSRSWKCSGRA
eukprot:COSAG02_NODE_1745_length_11097_cov_12.346518_6_plen_84_part_00